MAFENIVLLWRTKAPKAAGEPYGEASFRTFANHSSPLFFQQKGGPQRPPVPERDDFCAGIAIYACFLPFGKDCTHFPLAFTKRPGATPLLGRRLRAGRTFASPFWNLLEQWLLWRLRVRFGAATCMCWMTRRRSGSVA
mgnify:CR=1 FL=1